jgi:hypothetical protein
MVDGFSFRPAFINQPIGNSIDRKVCSAQLLAIT